MLIKALLQSISKLVSGQRKKVLAAAFSERAEQLTLVYRVTGPVTALGSFAVMFS